MKKWVVQILVWIAAVNFLFLGMAAAWVYKRAGVDRQKLNAIRQILFPTTAPALTMATTQPATQPTTQPSVRLEELLAKYAGRPPSEQLEYIRTAFDAQQADLDRALADLQHMQGQVRLAQKQLETDRQALEEEKKKLAAKEKEATRLASDKGFQDTLALYEEMPAKQVKSILMSFDDATVVQYLKAMEPRTVTKIAKEFKTPDEVKRLNKLMGLLRQAQPTTRE